jgi:hypothetical protein
VASLPAMALPLSVLTPGRTVHLRLDGEVLTGAVIATANGWLRLSGADGELVVNLAQVAWIRADGQPADERPVPTAKNLGAQPGSRVPGRPWPDETIRAVVEGFLNDVQDGELAERHGRTRHQITILRQAWECARGNLADDQLSPAAQLWVARIRNAMRP